MHRKDGDLNHRSTGRTSHESNSCLCLLDLILMSPLPRNLFISFSVSSWRAASPSPRQGLSLHSSGCSGIHDIDQAGLKVIAIHPPLPPESWYQKCALPCPAGGYVFKIIPYESQDLLEFVGHLISPLIFTSVGLLDLFWLVWLGYFGMFPTINLPK